MSKANKSDDNTIMVILAILGVLIIAAIISRMFKDIKKNTTSDIVSEQGKKVLGDPAKRENLRKAVEHFHKEGNWDLLPKVNE